MEQKTCHSDKIIEDRANIQKALLIKTNSTVSKKIQKKWISRMQLWLFRKTIYKEKSKKKTKLIL